MTATTLPLTGFRRGATPPLADGLAAAVAVSLPWSTSATGILVALWLVSCLPILDIAAVRREVGSAPGGMPVLLAGLALAGLLWAGAPAAERFRGFEPFLRLLMLPLLLAQYRGSKRALWIAIGFLVSDTILLALSWTMIAFDWRVVGRSIGVPVKDYIIQSGTFALCAFALLDFAFDRWIARRRLQAFGSALLALAFLANILYVATGRTTLVTIPVMFVMLGMRRLSRAAFVAFVLVGLLGAAAVWTTSDYVRARTTSMFTEIATTRDTGAETSAADRLAFWQQSLTAIAQAPVFGHGTGTIQEIFRRGSRNDVGPTATNPHNEILAVGIQFGAVGMALLIAMWAVHWRLFLVPGLAGWIGLLAVTQNIIGSLFNSHLMDFTQAWLYVFAVGAFGGTVLRRREADAPGAARPNP
jgi:O-antigen ligase